MRNPSLFPCPPQPAARPAIAGYRLTCPILNPAVTMLALQAEARTQLLDRLDAEGWLLAGPIVYEQRGTDFIATTTVRAVYDPDDARPWETREAYAADQFDLLAA
jgi:hypothetical protein